MWLILLTQVRECQWHNGKNFAGILLGKGDSSSTRLSHGCVKNWGAWPTFKMADISGGKLLKQSLIACRFTIKSF